MIKLDVKIRIISNNALVAWKNTTIAVTMLARSAHLPHGPTSFNLA